MGVNKNAEMLTFFGLIKKDLINDSSETWYAGHNETMGFISPDHLFII